MSLRPPKFVGMEFSCRGESSWNGEDEGIKLPSPLLPYSSCCTRRQSQEQLCVARLCLTLQWLHINRQIFRPPETFRWCGRREERTHKLLAR